ncbi:uncharacterized protein JN550_004948 [Neoarthrinium moseri]|uniref:uncharacterized protein n=1 Tax=Neoarthrinium moseri TaxID=1658444 RepID=UPI001FDBAA9D|nr:uncharacterized protein JN550_004948 [Neoarthrinium moseri]KAI1870802.1 hypothetical protein JN550_004948 [Neoarthrinium moseri]
MTATTINRFETDKVSPEALGIFHDSLIPVVEGQSTSIPLTLDARPALEDQRYFHSGDWQSNHHLPNHPIRERSVEEQEKTWNGFTVTRSMQTPRLRVSPTTSTEALAFAYFRNQYLAIQPQSLDPGYLNVLRLLIRRQDMGSCLETCMATLAMATFSRRPNSRAATVKAQALYSTALKAVNESIGASGYGGGKQTPPVRKGTSAYSSENLISNNIAGFRNHLSGAVAIIQSRGKKKFHDELGAELFMLLRFELFKTAIMRFVEPPDKYPYDWVMSIMKLVDDPCLPMAHRMLEPSRRGRLDAVIHSSIDNLLADNPYEGGPLAPLGLPSAFTTDGVMDTMTTRGVDVVEPFKEYLREARDAFSSNIHIPGHSVQDFKPRLCKSEASLYTIPSDGIPQYTWKSMEHASLSLSMCTSQLHGCNVAAKFAAKLEGLFDFKKTIEYQGMEEQARNALSTIVGSVSYLCGWGREAAGALDSHEAEIEDTREFMWPHIVVPLFSALESPFSNERERSYLASTLRYIADEKGIKLAEAMLDLYQQSPQTQPFKEAKDWHQP